MSSLLAFVLAAAPVVSVTSSEVRVDGRVVLASISEDASLGLPPLEAALRSASADGGTPGCALELAPDVPFKLLARAVFTCARAGVALPTLRVGAVGPVPLPPAPGAATKNVRAGEVVAAVSPTAVTFRGPGVASAELAGAPTSDAVRSKLGARASSTVLTLTAGDDVTAERLASVLAACHGAGVAEVRVMTVPAPGTVGLGGPAPGGTPGHLEPERIRKVIQANRAEVARCFNEALTRKPNLGGKLIVKFAISPAGAVASAQVVEDAVGDAALGGCVTSTVRRWAFPKPKGDGPVIVTYPFVFKRTD